METKNSTASSQESDNEKDEDYHKTDASQEIRKLPMSIPHKWTHLEHMTDLKKQEEEEMVRLY